MIGKIMPVHFVIGPRVLTNMSSGVIKAKEGDLVNLLCSAQGEPPITFSWEKDQKPLESLTETEKPHRSSFLVLKVKHETSFGKYICHIRDRFQSTTHTISVKKLEDTSSVEEDTGNNAQLKYNLKHKPAKILSNFVYGC